MTTAPTPEEVRALAERLEHCVAKWGKQNALSLEAYSAVKMMRRLQAENERLQQLLQCDTPRYCSSVQRCTAGDEHRAELEVRKPLPPARVDELMAEAGYLGASAERRADFINGIRHGELVHGIKET